MIVGQFHTGSGLGNQLHRYIMTRVLAMDKGLEWGMDNPGNFKGHSLFKLDMGQPIEGIEHIYNEKRVNNEEGVDIRGYDWEGINHIKDNTVIDGEFQGELYYEHHRERINSWLKVEPIDLGDNICILNFRGGEYLGYSDLFLSRTYWYNAINKMLEKNPHMIFRVVTDDVDTARLYFPTLDIQHEISKDWRSIRYAKYLILSNSSFAILPAWLNNEAYIIAPKYWARHNVSYGYWAMSQNMYKNWMYMNRKGELQSYQECVDEEYVHGVFKGTDSPEEQKVMDIDLYEIHHQ